MYLIVGLGNPEPEYENTRHNMGFNVINKIADACGIEVTQSKFKGLFGMGEIKGEKVHIQSGALLSIVGKAVLRAELKGFEFAAGIPGTLGGNKKLKIYGKLDCKSALSWIGKGYYISNRVFFENEEVAKQLGYRPCGVCMKKEYKKWKDSHK